MLNLTRRQMLTAAAAACAPALSHAQGGGGMKWHPGQYIHIPSRGGVAAVEDTLDQIRNIQSARGLQLRYTWAELETDEGKVDASRILEDLDRVSKYKKRLHVLLMLKSFAGGNRPVPDYLEKKTERGGATFNIGIEEKEAPGGPRKRNGQNIALWEPGVLRSLEEFLRGLGRQIDGHPALEGVAINETSLGKAADRNIEDDDKVQFFRNLASANRAMRKAFPTTVTIQFVNFPKQAIPILVDQMPEYGIGLGGPDVFLDDRSLRDNVYVRYPALAGVIPLAPSIQYENYVALKHQGERTVVPLEDLYNFARNQLRANYLFWTRPQQGLKNVWPDVLNFLRNHPQASQLTGGLATACPSSFKGGCSAA